MHYNYTSKDVSRFWSKVDIGNIKDCWEWKASTRHGRYGQVRWGIMMKDAHRVAYELTFGKIQGNLHVCHRCDNPRCCNPNHLFLGTAYENIRDMINKGRKVVLRGENSPVHKLTDVQVREIRERYSKGGISYDKLAEEYGVSDAHIGFLIRRKSRT